MRPEQGQSPLQQMYLCAPQGRIRGCERHAGDTTRQHSDAGSERPVSQAGWTAACAPAHVVVQGPLAQVVGHAGRAARQTSCVSANRGHRAPGDCQGGWPHHSMDRRHPAAGLLSAGAAPERQPRQAARQSGAHSRGRGCRSTSGPPGAAHRAASRTEQDGGELSGAEQVQGACLPCVGVGRLTGLVLAQLLLLELCCARHGRPLRAAPPACARSMKDRRLQNSSRAAEQAQQAAEACCAAAGELTWRRAWGVAWWLGPWSVLFRTLGAGISGIAASAPQAALVSAIRLRQAVAEPHQGGPEGSAERQQAFLRFCARRGPADTSPALQEPSAARSPRTEVSVQPRAPLASPVCSPVRQLPPACCPAPPAALAQPQLCRCQHSRAMAACPCSRGRWPALAACTLLLAVHALAVSGAPVAHRPALRAQAPQLQALGRVRPRRARAA